MDRNDSDPPPWYRIAGIAERHALTAGAAPGSFDFDPARAEKRLAKWRAQAPFGEPGWLEQRCAADGLDLEGFRRVLGSTPAAGFTPTTEPPAWRFWQRVVALCNDEGCGAAIPRLPPADDGVDLGGFMAAIEPFLGPRLAVALAEVEKLSKSHGELLERERTTELLLMNLRERALGLASRTLVLELHVARLSGRLPQPSAAERFAAFGRLLGEPEYLVSLFEEYPLLAQQLERRVGHWLDFGLELLHHVCADWPRILTTFEPAGAVGPLVSLDAGLGDRHRRGRAVAVAHFRSGFRLVYKPRSMAVDICFQRLLAWLNQNGQDPALRTLRILDRGRWGYMEFVTHEGCRDHAEVRRFYRRQGAFLALLYLLEASDFHFENLIAAGEHPVMIDLESLFQPRAGGMDLHLADLAAANTLGHSVLRVGLLPDRMWAEESGGGIDLSGLGAKGGQVFPRPIPAWDADASEGLRLRRENPVMPEGHHRPRLGSAAVELVDHQTDLIEGFTATWQLLSTRREALGAADGPLAAFAEHEVRVILRPTHVYGLLLQESFHPDLLRDALERERHFDHLWLAVRHRPGLAAAVAAEKADLEQGDIPLFTSRPASRDLFASDGTRIEGFFDDAGLDLVQRRLHAMDDDDLARQLWFLRGSLAAATVDLTTAAWPSYPIAAPRRAAGRERLLQAARAVGDRLEQLALAGGEEVTWIGLTSQQGRHWRLAPLRVDLYSGTPGIVLFLAHLGALTGEARYTELARRALVGVRRQVARDPALVNGLGAMSGWGGLIYTLDRLAALWGQRELHQAAVALAAQLPERFSDDDGFDFLGGLAGGIVALCTLGGETARRSARACGERLLARAVVPPGGGRAWEGDADSRQPLAGFAHGAAGAALALLQLAELCGENRFHDAALAAIAYERTLFEPKVGNWRDMRRLEVLHLAERIEGELYLNAWCHGAAGIGLARLAGLARLDDAEVRAEIEIALATTLARGFGDNHCLCHGDLGNLELLLQAAQKLDRERWQPEVERLTAVILDSIEDHGWLCGVPLGFETPGLMTGLAGVGYQLLRLAEPERVPCVLTLERVA